MERHQEFFIPCDGAKLHAKLDLPEGRKHFPLCILVHGVTGHMEEPHLLAVRDCMLEEGVGVLRLDMYGHGLSDGRFYDHTVMTWVLHLLKVIDFAWEQDYVTKLYLAGHSQGGCAVVLAAGMKADQLDALIPMSPAMFLREGARSGNLLGYTFDPEDLPDEVEIFRGRLISSNYLRVNRFLPIDETIEAFNKPVLVIHGDGDLSVPCEEGVKLARRYADGTLAVIPGAPHCFDDQLEELVVPLRQFIRRLADE